ncbi:MAG: hypothetical protein ACYCYE_07235 [Clostridia bacterium]
MKIIKNNNDMGTNRIDEINNKEARDSSMRFDGCEVPSFKGGKNKMTTITSNDKLFTREVVGMRTLRNNLSEYISKAINNFQEVLTANNAVKGGKTVSIISTEMLKVMLDSCCKFNSSITYDDVTSQYTASVKELDADGQGKTREEAINVLLDNIIVLTEDYFENVQLYLRIENSKAMLPYYERIKHCEDRSEMIRVLGLD